MNINPEIAYRELEVQHEFLKQRVRFLAQSLANVTAERDQALADRDAYRAQLEEKVKTDGAAE